MILSLGILFSVCGDTAEEQKVAAEKRKFQFNNLKHKKQGLSCYHLLWKTVSSLIVSILKQFFMFKVGLRQGQSAEHMKI